MAEDMAGCEVGLREASAVGVRDGGRRGGGCEAEERKGWVWGRVGLVASTLADHRRGILSPHWFVLLTHGSILRPIIRWMHGRIIRRGPTKGPRLVFQSHGGGVHGE